MMCKKVVLYSSKTEKQYLQWCKEQPQLRRMWKSLDFSYFEPSVQTKYEQFLFFVECQEEVHYFTNNGDLVNNIVNWSADNGIQCEIYLSDFEDKVQHCVLNDDGYFDGFPIGWFYSVD